MFNIFGKYKNIVIGIITFLVVILIIYFYGKHKGKASATGPKVTYPNNGDGIPKGWSPSPLAKELKNVMSGLFTLSGTKEDTFHKLLVLPTDDMFAAVYSAFNQLYFALGDGTLREWINAEKYTDWTSNTITELNDRFDKLNLQ